MSDIISPWQLPEPVMIFGDFNFRHPLWDSETPPLDAQSQVLESEFLSFSLSVLNTGVIPTLPYKPPLTLLLTSPCALLISFWTSAGSQWTNSLVATTSLSVFFLNFSWQSMDKLFGSDHFPLRFEELTDEKYCRERWFMEHCADWPHFNSLMCVAGASSLLDRLSVHELNDNYSLYILNAARLSLFLSPLFSKVGLKKLPWWNAQCVAANAQWKHTLTHYCLNSFFHSFWDIA